MSFMIFYSLKLALNSIYSDICIEEPMHDPGSCNGSGEFIALGIGTLVPVPNDCEKVEVLKSTLGAEV